MTWANVIKQMEENKNYTATELNTHAATMTALVKRGYVEKQDGRPASYRVTSKGRHYAFLWDYITKNCIKEYIGLIKEGQEYGMLCKIKGNDILDCYDNLYDIEGAKVIERYGKEVRFCVLG